MTLDLVLGEILATEVAREEHLEENLHDLARLVARRQKPSSDEVTARILAVARQHTERCFLQRVAFAHGFTGAGGCACIVSTSANMPSNSAPVR